MMGEREATIVAVKPFDLHGMTYYDVAVRFADLKVERTRLGPESVPADLRAGERALPKPVYKSLPRPTRPLATTA